MRESEFQKQVVDEIKSKFPGCIVMKNNSAYIQGIPDWSVFYKSKYAFLEIKISETAHKQPNQDYYIQKVNDEGSFGRFIFPKNKTIVLDEMQAYFKN